jgi:hypothetical protein
MVFTMAHSLAMLGASCQAPSTTAMSTVPDALGGGAPVAPGSLTPNPASGHRLVLTNAFPQLQTLSALPTTMAPGLITNPKPKSPIPKSQPHSIFHDG